MLFKCKMLGAQRKMLRCSFITMNPVRETDPVKRGGVIALETMGWYKNLHLVIFFCEFRGELQISGIAMEMGVFGTKMRQLLRLDSLNGLWQKEKLMGKPSGKSCRFKIAGVEEKLDRITPVKAGIKSLFERLLDKNIDEQA